MLNHDIPPYAVIEKTGRTPQAKLALMVYGSVVNGKGGRYNIGAEKSQLPLFALRLDLLNIRTYWWLRDVCSERHFVFINNDATANLANASLNVGVRPVFSISA